MAETSARLNEHARHAEDDSEAMPWRCVRDAASPVVTPWSARASGFSSPSQLADVVKREIVPRLVMTHGSEDDQKAPDADAGSRAISEAPRRIDELTALILGSQAEDASPFLIALHERGASLESLYLGLLAPVARHLGVLWQQDRCNFSEVTIALTHLHVALHDLSRSDEAADPRADARRVLLLPVPGDQHSFGLAMVADFFRRDGWKVIEESARSPREVATLVGDEWYAVAGFSLANERQFDALASAIRAARRASRNPDIGILVGGSVFMERPDLVTLVGADATAADAPTAVRSARRLLSVRSSR